jgi:hypothetical protein
VYLVADDDDDNANDKAAKEHNNDERDLLLRPTILLLLELLPAFTPTHSRKSVNVHHVDLHSSLDDVQRDARSRHSHGRNKHAGGFAVHDDLGQLEGGRCQMR